MIISEAMEPERQSVRMPAPFDHRHLGNLFRIVLLDLEFTCWEDSLATDWADPARPPEILSIGAAVLRLPDHEISDVFHAWVKPVVNPTLSLYCLNLLKVKQEEIDCAHDLPQVLRTIAEWKIQHVDDLEATCSWGSDDRTGLTLQAGRFGQRDPFSGCPHLDLMEACALLLGQPRGSRLERDEVRAKWRLSSPRVRHRALEDALDLAGFLAAVATPHRISNRTGLEVGR